MRKRESSDPNRFALDEGLQSLRLIWAVNHTLQGTMKGVAGTQGITGSQRLVIRIIGRCPRISARHLAGLLLVDPSTLAGVLKRLKNRGLICAALDPRDHRQRLLGLTPKGRALDVDAEGTVEWAVGRLFAQLSSREASTTRRVFAHLTRIILTEATRPNSRTPGQRGLRSSRVMHLR